MVLGLDQSFISEIANQRLKILRRATAHLLYLFADIFILRAQFTAQRTEGTAEHLAKPAVHRVLVIDQALAILAEPFQRRILSGKYLIEQGTLGFPMTLKSGHGQIGFGLESVIEAALVDPGFRADVIHADGAVAALPNQLKSGFEELPFRFTFLFHKDNIVDWSV